VPGRPDHVALQLRAGTNVMIAACFVPLSG
jgi:hypothetical protein